jgi:hypothetical protein
MIRLFNKIDNISGLLYMPFTRGQRTDRVIGESFNLPVPTISINNSSVLGSVITKIDRYTYKYLHIASVGENATIILGSTFGTQIRYSMTGKSPTHNSKLYTGPIVLDHNFSGNSIITIKARAYTVVNGKPSMNSKSPVIIAQFGIK